MADTPDDAADPAGDKKPPEQEKPAGQEKAPGQESRASKAAGEPEDQQPLTSAVEPEPSSEDVEDKPLDLQERRAAETAFLSMGQGVAFGAAETAFPSMGQGVAFGGTAEVNAPIVGGDHTEFHYHWAEQTRAVVYGPVAREFLNDLPSFYVEPNVHAQAKQMLGERRVLVLYGVAHWGKRMMALSLLDELSPAGVHTLSPDEDVRRLGKDEVKEGHGYLIHALAPAQVRHLNEFRLSVLSNTFRESKGHLVITVNSGVVRRHELPAQGVVSCEQPPDPTLVLAKHLARRLHDDRREEILAHPRVQELLGLASLPPHRVAGWATVLANAICDGLSVEDALPKLDQQVQRDVEQWFIDNKDVESRAFMIALAVFNGAPYQDVLDAATRLETQFRRIENPDSSPGRALFSLTKKEQLERTLATCSVAQEMRTIGTVPVEACSFVDSRYAPVVLDTIWQHPAVRRPLFAWLKELASHPSARMRVHAAMAIGRLGLLSFGYVHDEIIRHWSRHAHFRLRQSVAWMLAVPACDPTLGHAVRALLDEWSSGGGMEDARWRTLTAATAYGTTFGLLFPDVALKGLERIAGKSDDGLVDRVVSYSITSLFEAGNYGKVLRALAAWTRPPPATPEAMRQVVLNLTGIVCFLRIAREAVVDPAPAEGTWPHLLAVTHGEERGLKQLVTLWRRSLTHQLTVDAAQDVLREWVSKADDDPRLRDVLQTLLGEMARTDREAKRISYNLHAWARDPEHPSTAAEQLLTKLNRRGVTNGNGHP